MKKTKNITTPVHRAQFRPFAHVAFRGESPDTASTYISSSPNWGYPMGYKGRINGEVVTDHAALRAEYYAIIAEVES